jgi:hypothetical protein
MNMSNAQRLSAMKLPLRVLLMLAVAGCSGSNGSALDFGSTSEPTRSAPTIAPAATDDAGAPASPAIDAGEDAGLAVSEDAGATPAPVAPDAGPSVAPTADDAGSIVPVVADDAGAASSDDAGATEDAGVGAVADDAAPSAPVFACVATTRSGLYPASCVNPWGCLTANVSVPAAAGCSFAQTPFADTIGTLPNGVEVVTGPSGNAIIACCPVGTSL